mmetsp:Transcript_556/g.1204  ORF Transcript_556/g.1204 Transcript_556/m.1204 type:complete len:88 (-) Transcript_556:223-486(-)
MSHACRYDQGGWLLGQLGDRVIFSGQRDFDVESDDFEHIKQHYVEQKKAGAAVGNELELYLKHKIDWREEYEATGNFPTLILGIYKP